MNKKISIGFGVFAVLLAALLIIPSFVDLNKWKPEIQTAASKALDRDVHIDGDISLSILPYPGVTLSSVRIANAKWSASPEMIAVGEITFTVSLMPLITKTIEFSQLSLISPSILLESDKDGRYNWDFLENLTKKPSKKDQNSPEDDAFGGWSVTPTIPRINIQKGSFTYMEGPQVYKIANFQAALKSNSVQGPYLIKGAMKLNEKAIDFKADIGELKKGIPLTIDTNLQIENQQIQVTGAYNFKTKDFEGHLNSKINPTDIAGDLSPIQSEVSVRADISYQPNQFHMAQLSLTGKDLKATGDIKVNMAKTTQYELKLESLPGETSLNVGGSLTKWSEPQGNIQLKSDNFPAALSWIYSTLETHPDLKTLKFGAEYAVKENALKISNIDFNVNENKISGAIDVKSNEINLNLSTQNLSSWMTIIQQENVSQTVAKASLTGQIVFEQEMGLKTQLSFANGHIGMQGKVSKKNNKYDLALDVSYPNLSELLTALGIKISKISLGNLIAKVQVSGDSEHIKFAGLKGSLTPLKEAIAFSGDGSVDFSGSKLSVKTEINIGSLRMNDFLTQTKATSTPKIVLTSARSSPPENTKEWSKENIDLHFLNEFEADIIIKATKLVLNGTSIDELHLPIKVSQGALTSENISGDVNGGTLQASCDISTFDSPKAKLKFDLKNAALEKRMAILNADATLSAAGSNAYDLLSNLEGEINLAANSVNAPGIDAAEFEKRINSKQFVDIVKLLEGKPNGITRFDSITAHGLVNKGVIAIDQLIMKGPNLEGQSLGTINLVKQTLDLTNILSFKNIKNSPPFKVILTGSLFAPEKKIDAASLSSFILTLMGRKVLERALETPETVLKDTPGKIIETPGKALEAPAAATGTAKSLFKKIF